jgi:hypothetical protein
MTPDRLQDIFIKREKFMREIQAKFEDSYPENWPLDLSKKETQKTLRDTTFKGIEEMYEALFHLKNWKPHRNTEIPEVNREEFLEEIVDAFNYFFSLMILTGVDHDEFYNMFLKKDKIINDRLNNGY